MVYKWYILKKMGDYISPTTYQGKQKQLILIQDLNNLPVRWENGIIFLLHLFASVHLNAETHQNTTSRESYVMTHNSQISTAYTYSICCPMLGHFERIALLNYNPIWDEVVFWIPKDFTKIKFSSEATQLLLSAIQICWLRLQPKQKVHSGNREG